ncbi:MAG: marine proteobacterial sortase target protein [Alteromonadaceae bacterium]|nr:marine proteobacterial sortase target protein [Alteromonadaceae bacterium]
MRAIILTLWWPGTVTAKQVLGNSFFCVIATIALWLFALSKATAQEKQETLEQEWSFANGLFIYKSKRTTTPLSNASVEVSGEATPRLIDGMEENSVGYNHQQSEWLIPSMNTDVDMDIDGIVARVVVRQTFTNPTQDWVHARYQFPLPQDAAVDHLLMRVGHREIVGEIKQKQEAQKLFDMARERGQKASLVTQQRPNIFTSQVANIAPGEELQVEIGYQQLVRYQNDEFRLRFPTVYTPRFTLPESLLRQAMDKQYPSVPAAFSNFHEPLDTAVDENVASKLNLSITLRAGTELSAISSASYDIEHYQIDETTYQVNTPYPQVGDEDFELVWRPQQGHEPKVLHYRQATSDGEYGLFLLLPSTDESVIDEIERSITFVVDTSGSMAGESMQQAKAALRLAINSLSDSTRFNIVQFNTYADSLWQSPRYASPETRQEALAYLAGLNADGSTNMIEAIELALAEPVEHELLNQMVFITDGAVDYEQQLLALVAAKLNQTRLFTVGIGSAPNSYFMQAAAAQGKGTFTHISDIVQVEERINELFGKLSSPNLIDVAIDYGMEVEQYPQVIPDLYKGEPVVVSYLSPAPLSEATVSGKFAEQRWLQSLDLPYFSDSEGIAKYWAQKKIDWYKQLQRKSNLTDLQRAIAKSEITEIALKHNLVSDYTSLVAIERTIERPAMASQSFHRMSAQSQAVMPQTATSAMFSMLLGIGVWLVGLFFALCSGVLKQLLVREVKHV